MKKLSIIIPVYNEDQTVEEVIEKVANVKLPGITKEILVINDGSTDQTKSKLSRAAKSRANVSVYNSIINLGKGAAVRIGLAKCSGDIIIIQDADLELDPNEYYKILNPIITGKAKVVYGTRFWGNNNHQISFKTRFANLFLTKMVNLLYSANLTDMETAYKAFTRDVLTGIRLRALEFEFEPEITARILKKGLRITEVPITYNPRSKKEGKKMRAKDGLEAVYTILRCRFF